MKVILTDEIKSLGHRGDIVEVSAGYARNFLLPKELALPATPGNQKRLEQQRKQYDLRVEKDREKASEVARAIEGTTLVLRKKAGEHDALYGSVTSSELAEALAAKGFTIDKRRIELEEPIKRLGTHTVHVKLHKDVTVGVQVEVLAG
ncbi:50S ribosomal protein L9 [Acidobacteria bacterium ACD]|nr:MAG: 50S ribosomal protein L9 [Acidobacteriota bacterium]MCE7958017.1 50S ribosomal protein L9 [Acidobacteria bacterium ACB2]MDL1951413.1 50S ribosomal protein L9 [Acidobacteria bacterium ACD]